MKRAVLAEAVALALGVGFAGGYVIHQSASVREPVGPEGPVRQASPSPAAQIIVEAHERPPRLTDGPLTGAYRTAYGQNLRSGFRVSRADVADLMLRVLEQPETIKEVIGIAS